MNFTFFPSFFSAASTPPPLSIDGFNPFDNEEFITPAGQATTNVVEHWFFSQALPEWISYVIVFAAGVSVLMIVAAGVMLMLRGEDEELQQRGTKTIVWAIAGLIISTMAYTIVEVVNRVPIEGTNPEIQIDIDEANSGLANLASGDLRGEIIPDIIKIVLNLVGTLALMLIVYAGALLVMRDGDEERVTKARLLITWAIVGIITVVIAYVIVEAVVQINLTETITP